MFGNLIPKPNQIHYTGGGTREARAAAARVLAYISSYMFEFRTVFSFQKTLKIKQISEIRKIMYTLYTN